MLTDEERETLRRWARRAKSAKALAQRYRIVSGCAAGESNKEVVAEVGVWPQTVCKWRQWFVESRLDGLADEPRLRHPSLKGNVCLKPGAVHARYAARSRVTTNSVSATRGQGPDLGTKRHQ